MARIAHELKQQKDLVLLFSFLLLRRFEVVGVLGFGFWGLGGRAS